jgi:hypothetical protein
VLASLDKTLNFGEGSVHYDEYESRWTDCHADCNCGMIKLDTGRKSKAGGPSHAQMLRMSTSSCPHTRTQS